MKDGVKIRLNKTDEKCSTFIAFHTALMTHRFSSAAFEGSLCGLCFRFYDGTRFGK